MSSTRQIVEAIRFDQAGAPTYSRARQDPLDIEAKPHRTVPGEVNTHMPYGRSLKTRGVPNIRMTTRQLKTRVGATNLRVLMVFSRGHIDQGRLDAIKLADFDGAEHMLTDAASYAAAAFEHTRFDCVMPAPSSKPLARKFADAIAKELGLPVQASFKKLATAKDSHVSLRGTTKLVALDNTDVPNKVLLVDDFTTSNATLVDMAQDLYNAGAEYVAGLALVGPAQSEALQHSRQAFLAGSMDDRFLKILREQSAGRICDALIGYADTLAKEHKPKSALNEAYETAKPLAEQAKFGGLLTCTYWLLEAEYNSNMLQRAALAQFCEHPSAIAAGVDEHHLATAVGADKFTQVCKKAREIIDANSQRLDDANPFKFDGDVKEITGMLVKLYMDELLPKAS